MKHSPLSFFANTTYHHPTFQAHNRDQTTTMSSQEHRGDVVGVLDSRQVGEEFEYLVRWTGGEETWVERSILEDDAPRVLDTFRRHNPSHHFRSVDLEDGYQEWIRGVQWRHEHKMPVSVLVDGYSYDLCIHGFSFRAVSPAISQLVTMISSCF